MAFHDQRRDDAAASDLLHRIVARLFFTQIRGRSFGALRHSICLSSWCTRLFWAFADMTTAAPSSAATRSGWHRCAKCFSQPPHADVLGDTVSSRQVRAGCCACVCVYVCTCISILTPLPCCKVPAIFFCESLPCSSSWSAFQPKYSIAKSIMRITKVRNNASRQCDF